MTIIFTTIHGSRLYGLDHAGSDHDTYTVVTNGHYFGENTTRQRVHGYGDTVSDDITFTFDEFMKRVEKGSHQALEAMFSPVKEWTTEVRASALKSFVENYYATSPEVFAAYERTIRKFAFGDFKRRRHGVRLAQNLLDLRHAGRFNPRMTPDQIRWANGLATNLAGKDVLLRLDIPLSDHYAGDNTDEKEKK